MARYATARYSVKEAREATWARRVALFFVQLMILTVLLHRFADLETELAPVSVKFFLCLECALAHAQILDGPARHRIR